MNRYTLSIFAILISALFSCSKKADNTPPPPSTYSGHPPLTYCTVDTSKIIYVPANTDTIMSIPLTVNFAAYVTSTVKITIGMLPSFISVDQLSASVSSDTLHAPFVHSFLFHLSPIDTGSFSIRVMASSYCSKSGSYEQTASVRFRAQ